MRTLIFVLLFSCSKLIFAQTEEHLDVLVADSTWTKEIIQFPLSFARDIPYKGYEDLRFHKDWAKKESEGFWAYAFAWHVKGQQKTTFKKLEAYMKLYYDGLANARDPKIPESAMLFIKNHNSNLDSDFIGKMHFYDRFHTKKMITLNALVKSFYCAQRNMTTIVFQISPKELDHGIWNTLKAIKVKPNVCDF